MVITPTGGLEYWEKFNHAVKAAAESTGIQTQPAAPQSVTDYTQQEQMVDKAIAQRVQGIIVSPAHQLVLATVLEKAVQARIPVVIVGSPVALPARILRRSLDGTKRRPAGWRRAASSLFSGAAAKSAWSG